MNLPSPGSLRGFVALAVVVGTFLWAAIKIVMYRAEETPADTITLRICHWQLETGVRDGLDQMAKEYQKVNPKVRVVQEAIPEGTYGQWVSTQLMGGTAPDIIEVGHGCLPNNVWLAYYNRYFVPLTRYVNRPNPYNKGTDLEHVPLRLTVYDGMRSSYVDELQEYMSITLSQFGVRVFYNKTLLKKLTGLDQAPTNYREFLAACKKIKSQKDPTGKYYTPIASSKYNFGPWEGYLIDLVTYPIIQKADFNRDGGVGNDETFVGFRTGRLDMNQPGYRARFKLMREITDFFQPGWTGLGRDEAVFLFAQQRAVFITTGTWDAMSLKEQAEGSFEVGVMEFPIPTPDDPEYGSLVAGPIYEKPTVGFPFALTRTSKHPEVALDFLLFLAGRKQNEQFNKIIGWIPGTRGAKVDPFLEAFKPHLDGVYPGFSSGAFNLGGETWIKWLQEYTLYQVGTSTYEQMVANFIPYYLKNGLKDFLEQQREWRRGILRNEQLLADIRAKALSTSGDRAVSEWIRYATLKEGRQIKPEVQHYQQMLFIQKATVPGNVGPYEYSETVLEKVRQRVKSATAKAI